MSRTRKSLKSSTIINPGTKLDTSQAPYVVVITPEELRSVPQLTAESIKDIAVGKGVPRHVVNGKFRAAQTNDGLMIEWNPSDA